MQHLLLPWGVERVTASVSRGLLEFISVAISSLFRSSAASAIVPLLNILPDPFEHGHGCRRDIFDHEARTSPPLNLAYLVARNCRTVLMLSKGWSTILTQVAARPLARPFLKPSTALASTWDGGKPPSQRLATAMEGFKNDLAGGLVAACVKIMLQPFDTIRPCSSLAPPSKRTLRAAAGLPPPSRPRGCARFFFRCRVGCCWPPFFYVRSNG